MTVPIEVEKRSGDEDTALRDDHQIEKKSCDHGVHRQLLEEVRIMFYRLLNAAPAVRIPKSKSLNLAFVHSEKRFRSPDATASRNGQLETTGNAVKDNEFPCKS